MTDDEHKQLASEFYKGSVLIGLDRMVARKFYMDLSLKHIEEQTGEAPYFEVLAVFGTVVAAHLALVASWVLSVLAFGWWSVLAIPASTLVYFLFGGHSSLPNHRLLGVSLVLVAIVIAMRLGAFPSNYVAWYCISFAFSLWAARFVYFAAGHFLRAFVLRNKKAYEMLSSYIDVKQLSQ